MMRNLKRTFTSTFVGALSVFLLVGADLGEKIRELDGTEFVEGRRIVVPESGLELTQDTTLKADEILIRGIITTRTHSLVIVTGLLTFEGDGMIRSFDPKDVPPVQNPEMRSAGNGPAGDDGKWVDHADTGPRGQDGGRGPQGLIGIQGYPGAAGGLIYIDAFQMNGTVKIDGQGQSGGQGGKGGTGGTGGRGGQGQHGDKDQDSCNGGNGGPGGNGGKGGTGGVGGRGAAILLKASNDISNFDITSKAGLGGKAGDAGDPGLGGGKGKGGEQEKGTVSAADADGGQNSGSDGLAGGRGEPGSEGPTGQIGHIKVVSVEKIASSMNVVRDAAYSFQFERMFWVLVSRTFEFANEKLIIDAIDKNHAIEQKIFKTESLNNFDSLPANDLIQEQLITSWNGFEFFMDDPENKTQEGFRKLSKAVRGALKSLQTVSFSESDLKKLKSNLEALEQARFARMHRRIDVLGRACSEHLNQIELEMQQTVQILPTDNQATTQSSRPSNMLINSYYRVPLCEAAVRLSENPMASLFIATPISALTIPENLNQWMQIQTIQLMGAKLKDPFARLRSSSAYASPEENRFILESLMDAEWSKVSKNGEKVSLRYLVHSALGKRRVTLAGILTHLRPIYGAQINTPQYLDFEVRLLGLYLKKIQGAQEDEK